jgi:GNAT superfamily N-acetyltransferase
MTQPVIRRAGRSDAAALSAIARATFTEAFDRTRAHLADPATAAWLIEAEGEIVGHALAGPCALPHPEVGPACGELKRLYVLGPWRGGLGSRLLETALGWLEREGPRRIWIGVWSRNFGALRLYERMGFARVGEYAFEVGGVRDHEFILRRG